MKALLSPSCSSVRGFSVERAFISLFGLSRPLHGGHSPTNRAAAQSPSANNESLSSCSSSPRSRSDWKYLPQWRRERLSIKHKLSSPASSPTLPHAIKWSGSEHARSGYWDPRKRLSPTSMSGVRSLHASDPETYDVPGLAGLFKVSPDAIRRILRSKWVPTPAEEQARDERWRKRKESIVRAKGVEEGGKSGRNTVKGNKDVVRKMQRQFEVPTPHITDERFL